MKKYRTEIIFTLCAMMGLLSIAALFADVDLVPMMSFVVISFGLIVWALVKSDREGFIKINRMPRAGDPQREFHPVQSFVLMLVAILQVVMSAYTVLTIKI